VTMSIRKIYSLSDCPRLQGTYTLKMKYVILSLFPISSILKIDKCTLGPALPQATTQAPQKHFILEIPTQFLPLPHELDRKRQGMTLGLSRFRGFCNGKLGSELYTVATFRLGQVRLKT